MYACCDCCGERKHSIGHVDHCPKHQRTEAAERAKAKKSRRKTESVEAL